MSENKNLKFRNWCLTIFDKELIDNFYDDRIRYAAFGEETCPETGRIHYQAFCCFKDPIKFCTIKKIFPGVHIERMKGSIYQNEKYCSKEGQLIEIGEKPKDSKEIGKDYWKEQLDLARIDPSTCDPRLQISHYKSLESINQKRKRSEQFKSLDILDNEWLVGPPGSGKSSYARKENPGAYLKQCNKWWNGYDLEEVVIIDDIDDTHTWMAYFINQWADHYPFPAEVKGGEMIIRPKRIIVTSRYMPDQIFKSISDIQSIERRFRFIHFPRGSSPSIT